MKTFTIYRETAISGVCAPSTVRGHIASFNMTAMEQPLDRFLFNKDAELSPTVALTIEAEGDDPLFILCYMDDGHLFEMARFDTWHESLSATDNLSRNLNLETRPFYTEDSSEFRCTH